MERWQVEDLFRTILNELDPEVKSEELKESELTLIQKEESSWESDVNDDNETTQANDENHSE